MQLHDTTRLLTINLPPRAKDITGLRFDRLVALRPVGMSVYKCVQWLCQCDCGNNTVVVSNNLLGRSVRSCGCLSIEKLQQRRLKHGQAGTPLFRLWYEIIRRCTDPKRKAYANYGGRGIRICDEWRQSFVAFRDYVIQLAHCGEEGYSLDRIDNGGNYEPGNLRWATRSEQARNKRNTRWLTYQGKTQSITAWAEELGVKQKVLEKRLRIGWTVERTLSTPLDVRRAIRATIAAASKGLTL